MSEAERQPSQQWSPARWAAVAVVTVVVVAVVMWILVGRGDDEQADPAPQGSDATESAQAIEKPSEEASASTTEWGALPPPNLGHLKTLSGPPFPDAVGAFVREDESYGALDNVSLSYTDEKLIRTLEVKTSAGSHHFASWVGSLEAPEVHGDVVCGRESTDFGDAITCIGAGTHATLKVSTMELDQITFDELVEFSNGLYRQL